MKTQINRKMLLTVLSIISVNVKFNLKERMGVFTPEFSRFGAFIQIDTASVLPKIH